MYAKTIIVGRLGRDPEMRHTGDGIPVASFSVAVDMGYGEAKHTVWYRVSTWRKLAETCNQFLTKGRTVLVEGDLREPKPFQGKDGQWRASLDLTGYSVKFLGGGRESGEIAEPTEGAGHEDMPF